MSRDVVLALLIIVPVLLAVIVAVLRLVIYGRDWNNVRFGLRLVLATCLIADAFLIFANYR